MNRNRPPLVAVIARNVLPAYVMPAAFAYANAQVIPDEALAAQVEAASVTTIAIPSAAASLVVTLWNHWRTPPRQAPGARVRKAFLVGGLTSLLIAAFVSAVLIGNGFQPLSLLQYTLLSALIGGGLAARAWVTSASPRGRRRRPASSSGATPPGDGVLHAGRDVPTS